MGRLAMSQSPKVMMRPRRGEARGAAIKQIKKQKILQEGK